MHTIDYNKRRGQNGAIHHSRDQIGEGVGSHTIDLNLAQIDSEVTVCLFVLSAYASASLLDITSASISFADVDISLELCSYILDSHDKVSHLKYIMMCKLYKTSTSRWHVQAIGDSYGGSADNYEPNTKQLKNICRV